MNFLKSNRLSLLLLLAMVGLSLYFYGKLPDSIATKFDFDGNPTQYLSKNFIALMLPLTFAGLIGLINVFIKVSPPDYSMPNSQKIMDKIIFGSGLLLFCLHFAMLTDPGSEATLSRYLCWGMALFLIVVGNVFGKTERNFFMGIRVPWTIATEANWKATHRFAGKLMVGFGVLLLAVSYFYTNIFLAIVFVLVPTLAPIYYSYRFYATKEKGKAEMVNY